MVDKNTLIICSAELENGYIFKNFFSFISLRGRPEITFLSDRIESKNRTTDNTIYGTAFLYGEEINLIWYQSNKSLTLTFDSSLVQGTFGKIKKKDHARIMIVQLKYNNQKPGDENDYVIYLSCGAGGDSREGIQTINAKKIEPSSTLIKQPISGSILIVPSRLFRQMIDSFGKCKKQQIHIYFFENKENQNSSGILISTNKLGSALEGIIEKYGDVPEIRDQDDSDAENEYIVESDKILIFSKLASMHNEGSIRVYYSPGHNLKFCYRFGSFGECELYLTNKFVEI